MNPVSHKLETHLVDVPLKFKGEPGRAGVRAPAAAADAAGPAVHPKTQLPKVLKFHVDAKDADSFDPNEVVLKSGDMPPAVLLESQRQAAAAARRHLRKVRAAQLHGMDV